MIHIRQARFLAGTILSALVFTGCVQRSSIIIQPPALPEASSEERFLITAVLREAVAGSINLPIYRALIGMDTLIVESEFQSLGTIHLLDTRAMPDVPGVRFVLATHEGLESLASRRQEALYLSVSISHLSPDSASIDLDVCHLIDYSVLRHRERTEERFAPINGWLEPQPDLHPVKYFSSDGDVFSFRQEAGQWQLVSVGGDHSVN